LVYKVLLKSLSAAARGLFTRKMDTHIFCIGRKDFVPRKYDVWWQILVGNLRKAISTMTRDVSGSGLVLKDVGNVLLLPGLRSQMWNVRLRLQFKLES